MPANRHDSHVRLVFEYSMNEPIPNRSFTSLRLALDAFLLAVAVPVWADFGPDCLCSDFLAHSDRSVPILESLKVVAFIYIRACIGERPKVNGFAVKHRDIAYCLNLYY